VTAPFAPAPPRGPGGAPAGRNDCGAPAGRDDSGAPAGRDHGGALDAAVARWGGRREDWLDLSTGINPVPYPLPPIPAEAWARLPDRAAAEALAAAARRFWAVPPEAELVAAPGLSALIARLPQALGAASATIPGPTYNEHEGAFRAAGVPVLPAGGEALVLVHPNNPDGRLWPDPPPARHLVVDESFCDPTPALSHVARAAQPGVVILKSFGKFWGLAGLRLGFAIGRGPVMARLREALGPWPVSGPALAVGAAALSDPGWAAAARDRLAADAARLDDRLAAAGARLLGGTTLFRLCELPDAGAGARRLAAARVLVRVFPYAPDWLRLGLPAPDRWAQLEEALAGLTAPA
jgi:cobalamin biosynthetic protein CobC